MQSPTIRPLKISSNSSTQIVKHNRPSSFAYLDDGEEELQEHSSDSEGAGASADGQSDQ